MSEKKFTWTAESGATITLPHVDSIKAGLLRKYRKLEPVDMVLSILEEVGDEDALAAFDDLELPEMNRFVEDWQEGVELGESGRSSTLSRSTGARSSTTGDTGSV